MGQTSAFDSMGRLSCIPLAILVCLHFAARTAHTCQNGEPAPAVHFPPDLNLGVHLFTDVNFTNKFESAADARNYVLKFFKSVFLRFRSTHDNLKLRLVNITLLNDSSVEEECFEYHTHTYEQLRKTITIKYLHLDKSMVKFKTCTKNSRSSAYLKDNVPLIYVLTGYDTAKEVNGKLKQYTGASQAQGGICTEKNVAIGRDDGRAFLGILTAARELGHLMGSNYDGWRLDSNKDVTDCHQASKHIMSYHEDSQNGHTFSSCSKLEMEARLRNYTCTSSTSNVNLINSTIPYPGIGVTPNDQCRNISEKLYAQGGNQYHCLLGCQTTRATGPVETYPMLDGMNCDRNKQCYKGLCLTNFQQPEF